MCMTMGFVAAAVLLFPVAVVTGEDLLLEAVLLLRGEIVLARPLLLSLSSERSLSFFSSRDFLSQLTFACVAMLAPPPAAPMDEALVDEEERELAETTELAAEMILDCCCCCCCLTIMYSEPLLPREPSLMGSAKSKEFVMIGSYRIGVTASMLDLLR